MRLRLFPLVLFTSVAAGCGSAPPLVAAGSASASPVAVDGDAADWGASLLAVAGKPLTVGVRNDGHALAVAVVTSDRAAIRQILETGLSVWLDAEGGTARSVGVTVPARDPGAAAPPPERETDAARAARFAAAPLRMRVTAGGEASTYALDAVPGLAVAVGFDGATFVAELRVPLAGDGLVRLDASPGSVVGVGIETRRPRGDDLRDRLDARASRGSATAGADSRRAARGVPPEALGERPDPVELWLRVTLAGG